jgi:hypothetical protein
MTAMTDDERKPTLNQLTFAFVPFALLMAASVLVAVLQPAVAYARARYLIWAALVLSTPALAEYALSYSRKPLSNYWRLFWSFGCVAYLVHLHYGFWVLFHGDFAAELVSQGTVVAISNWAATGLWSLDALLSWITRQRPSWILFVRFVTHLLVFVSFFLSAVIFHSGVVRRLGLVMTVTIVAAVAVRALALPQPSARGQAASAR